MENVYEIFDIKKMNLSEQVKEYVVNKRLEQIAKTGNFLHTLSPFNSKYTYISSRYADFFTSALKVYLPVHLILMLLRLRNKKDSIGTLLKRFIKGLFRSSIFVATFAISSPTARAFTPLGKLFNPYLGSWSGMIVSFLFSNSIFLENSSRWADISLYVLGQWVNGYSYSLVKREYVGLIPHIERYLLAFSMGLLAHLRYNGAIELRNTEWKDDERSNQMKIESSKIVKSIDVIIGQANMMLPWEEVETKDQTSGIAAK